MKDKDGKELEVLTKVNAEIGDDLFGGKTEVLALVDELLPDNKVLCIPVDGGVPFTVEAKATTRVDPLIERLLDACTDEEVQALLDEAFLRLDTAKAVQKGRKKSSGGSKSSSKKVNLAANLKL
jgi:hypothetical protein